MTRPLLLQQATVPAVFLTTPGLAPPANDIARVDLGVADGVIRFVVPAGSTPPEGWNRVPLAGGMVWPCFADLHTHMDTAQIWARTPNPDGSFEGAATAMVVDRETFWTPEDMRRRMDFGLRCAYAHGAQAIRTHLASQNDRAAVRWAIFRELRAEWAGRIDIQAASLIALDVLADEAHLEPTAALVKDAAGVLGCFAPMGAGLEANLHRVFEAAERHGLALDFHADETHDTDSQVLAAIASVALERRFQAPIVVGHCSSLAMQDEAVIDRTLDQVAEAKLKVVSLPSCNLYLQDRRAGRTPRWRGVTLLHEMRARGIDVAIGSDNVRDPFHPYGDYDMLDTFRDAVRIAHLDHPIGAWPAAVTQVPAAIIGEIRAGLAVGDPANLVVFSARSFNELLSRPQADRRIVRRGRFVRAKLPDYRELDPN